MTDTTILAVDLGTSSMKVALISVNGNVLGWESEPLRLIFTNDNGVEQSPQEWWAAFLSTSKRLLSKHLGLVDSIRAVCCSTQGEGTVAIDREGNPLGNCILWMDMRGAPHLRRQLKGWFNLDGFDIFKVMRFVQLTGGMPNPAGKDPAGHMVFIRATLPDVYSKTWKFLNVLDYMNWRLSGVFAASFDSIITSWVTDNRDPNKLAYHDGLISFLGIDREKLPEVVPCTSVIGNLRSEVASELGLSSQVKVVAGAIDNTAAAIGSGAIRDFQPHLYIGTSSWIAAHVPFKKTDAASSLASIPCAIPDRYLLTALQATAGGNLVFLRDNILFHKDELLQQEALPDFFKVLDQMTARVPAGANGLVYTPWIWGERAPVTDKNLRAGLFNLSLNNTREDILRATLEGIALNTRWLMTPVEKFLGRKPGSINIAGGGAQSDVWCQIFADVLKVEINQTSEPICTNARGAAWIAAVGLGEIEFEDVPGLARFKKRYTPNRDNTALYEERFEVFQAIYSKMKNAYRRLNG